MYPEYKKTIQLITSTHHKYLLKEYRFDYYSYEQVEDIRQKVYFLRYKFITHKVPIVDFADITTKRTPKGYSVLIKEKFAGLDFIDITNEANLIENLKLLLDKTISPMFKANLRSFLPFGLDTNLRNFVLDPLNKVFLYNHFMPPRAKNKEMYFIEISEMSGIAQMIQKYRFFNLTGVLYSLYLSIIFYYYNEKSEVFELLKKFALKYKYTREIEHLKGRTALENMKPNELVKRLKQTTEWDEESYFFLLHTAMITMNYNSLFKKNILTFFKSISLNRKSKYEKLHCSKDSLNNAKIILINNLEKIQNQRQNKPSTKELIIKKKT